MSKINKLSKSPPAAVEEILYRLGKNIRIARLRRNMRLEDLAERVGVSRYLIADVEKGKPTAGVYAYVGALWVLGLIDDLAKVADPDRDREGKALEAARTPKTAAKRKRSLDNDF
ncbi:MAG: helix-turn-helix transcriptional regulator [Gammaproteobacteria bacterium]|nr:helix-turn-helix transcriptional regulator [Gammaproteobacteria bacterium]